MSDSLRIRKAKAEARSTSASGSSSQPTSSDQLRQRLLALILKNEAARKAPKR
jgi:hypothetical protein